MKYEKGSFVLVPNKQALKKLTLGARAVFVEICDFADDNGRCFPSRSKIAENIIMSTDSVDRFIAELLEAGFIEKSGRVRPDGSRTSNEYQILLVGSRTDTQGASRTHSEAELYPVLTQPITSEIGISQEYRIAKDEPEGRKKKNPDSRAYPNAKAVFRLFGKAPTHKYPLHWVGNVSQMKAAQNLYNEHGLEEIASLLKWYEKHKPKDFPWDVSTPWDLEAKWMKLDAYFDKLNKS